MSRTHPKLLYVDVPFEREPGGDKNRSRFLWETLHRGFGASLALIVDGGTRPALGRHEINVPARVMESRPAPWLRSQSIPSFDERERESFVEFVRKEGFEVVFCRFCVAWELMVALRKALPQVRVIVDVDMVSSRLAGLAWRSERSVRNRWFLFEQWKLGWFERGMFREPWLFLFTNPEELEWVRRRVRGGGQFDWLPNIMPREENIVVKERKPMVLFFGALDSAANRDGFLFLVDEVYPLIEAALKEAGVSIHIAGANPPSGFAERASAVGGGRIVLLGRVESMAKTIAESMFVLLPLRVASGTRTRILEAGAMARAVVTTPIGAEGLGLSDSVLIGTTARELADHTIRLLKESDEAHALGVRLKERCQAMYHPDRVAEKLRECVRSWAMGSRTTRSQR